MRSGEPDTQGRRDLCYHFQQIRKFDRLSGGFRMPGVGVDILPQQRHLFGAVFDQCLHLVENIPGITAAFAATGIRDDAVSTEIVATPRNRNKSGNLSSPILFGYDRIVGFVDGQFNIDGAFAQSGLIVKERQIPVGIRSGNQIDRFFLNQFIPNPFGHAAD